MNKNHGYCHVKRPLDPSIQPALSLTKCSGEQFNKAIMHNR